MPDILIERNHTLGMPAARDIARQWMQQAEKDYGMACSYAEGDACDVAKFGRPGIDGNVEVTADTFTLRATLGFIFGNFSDQIEQKLNENLDELLGASSAPQAGKGNGKSHVDEDDGYNDKDWR